MVIVIEEMTDLLDKNSIEYTVDKDVVCIKRKGLDTLYFTFDEAGILSMIITGGNYHFVLGMESLEYRDGIIRLQYKGHEKGFMIT